MTSLRRAASVADYRSLARRRLPNMLFEYIDGGSYAEQTLQRNLEDFAKLSLRQRVMLPMSELDMSVSTLGSTWSLPFALAPVGMAGMYSRRGEVQAAAAAASMGVPFCLSTMGICSVEEVARAGQSPWFQLYVLKDRGYMRELLRRAKSAGCPVLVLTVDLPTPGARYRDVRSGFRGLTGWQSMINQGIDGLSHPRWLWDVWAWGRPHTLGNIESALEEGRSVTDFLNWIAANFQRSLTWHDLDWIRAEWDGPIVVKGILDPEDAKAAKQAGAQGIIVSNHGGRQLDSVRSAVSALPPIVDLVGADLEVYVDSGIRSGLDVLKALALGARACFIGRAWAFALAAGGRAGVLQMLEILRAELEVAMILSGCQAARRASRAMLDER